MTPLTRRMAVCLTVCCIPLLALVGCVERVPEAPAGPPPGGEVINRPGAGSAPTGDGIKLELFTWTENDEYEVNRKLLAEFEAEHPGVKVNLVNISGSREAMQKLETKMAAKNGPDVMSLHGAYYVGFADAGVLADLEKFTGDDPEFHLDDFHPALVEMCRYKGTLYSLPRYTSVYSLFYNKSLFDAEGLPYPGKGSWTWADYLKAVKALTKDLDGDGTPDQWGCIIDFWGARLYPWLWSNDADLMDKQLEKCTLDDPKAIEALQFLVDLRHKHRACPASTSTERNEGLNSFARGNVGMYMSGPWDIQTLNQAEGLKWDVAPVPEKSSRATMLGTENYAIWSGTRHPKEAWALFSFLVSARSQAHMAQALDKMPSRISVLQGAYSSGSPGYDRSVYVKSLDYARVPPNFAEYSQVEGILQAELDRIWLGSVAPRDGLKAVTEKVNKKIKELRAQKG